MLEIQTYIRCSNSNIGFKCYSNEIIQSNAIWNIPVMFKHTHTHTSHSQRNDYFVYNCASVFLLSLLCLPFGMCARVCVKYIYCLSGNFLSYPKCVFVQVTKIYCKMPHLSHSTTSSNTNDKSTTAVWRCCCCRCRCSYLYHIEQKQSNRSSTIS